MTDAKPDIIGDSLAHLTDRLPGLTITGTEAVRLASTWWDKTGRRLINKLFNRDRVDTLKGPGANGAPAIRVKGTGDVVVPSQILEGLPWEQLGRRERALVVRSWLAQNRDLYAKDSTKVIVQ